MVWLELKCEAQADSEFDVASDKTGFALYIHNDACMAYVTDVEDSNELYALLKNRDKLANAMYDSCSEIELEEFMCDVDNEDCPIYFKEFHDFVDINNYK